MQRVLLLLNPEGIGKDVVALSLLPEIVELDQLAHRPGPHLLALQFSVANPYHEFSSKKCSRPGEKKKNV